MGLSVREDEIVAASYLAAAYLSAAAPEATAVPAAEVLAFGTEGLFDELRLAVCAHCLHVYTR